jgi:hypothetical protein
MHGGKVEKKYTSKAAQSYKAALANLVIAAAAKRGEGPTAAASAACLENGDDMEGNSLLANLDAADKKNQDAEAKMKLDAARTSSGVLRPQAKLASSLAGASRLLVKPGGGGLGTLRKPTSGTSSLLMKKKGSLTSTRPKARTKLSMKLTTNGSVDKGDDDDTFEDIEETRKNVAESQVIAKQEAEDAALAKQLQEDMIINGGASFDEPVVIVADPEPVSAPVAAPAPSISKKPTKDENIAKLKSMTNDFFSQM